MRVPPAGAQHVIAALAPLLPAAIATPSHTLDTVDGNVVVKVELPLVVSCFRLRCSA